MGGLGAAAASEAVFIQTFTLRGKRSSPSHSFEWGSVFHWVETGTEGGSGKTTQSLAGRCTLTMDYFAM